ncbi:MAG: DUF5011 domain-containing protein [Bacilli bacterium]|nr:DUF5011 domain-containing protein [Bacilli bacterium]
MKKLFMFLLVAFAAFGFIACNETTTATETTTAAATTTQAAETTTAAPTTTEAVNAAPVLSGVDDATVTVSDTGTFDATAGVTATDAEDGNLTTSIVVTGTVDLSVAGSYGLSYSVTDSDGAVTNAYRTVTVVLNTYANGFYNFKFATTELRHTFMAAAEDYLLSNMDGGIPLFDSGSYVIYDSRISLPVSTYIPVMGYGSSFATMTADDSTVYMTPDNDYGTVGEYTYRTTISENPGTWNQWLYDTSTDSTLMGWYYGSPYTYHFNAEKTGYEVVASMASGDPVPVGSRVTDTGKTVAYTWEVTLRNDLEWYFHPDTPTAFTSTLVADDYVIDATDFIDTFQLALTEGWFRAISGGGDFVTSAQEIVGAGDFYDAEQASAGSGDWDSVGLKVKEDGNDLTMVFTFVDEQSDWNVRYWLSSFVMTPINLEYYDYLLNDGDDDTTYGIDESSIGYTGAYYVDFYQSGVSLVYAKNPSYYDPTEYFFDGVLMYVENDPDLIWAKFEAGLLDGAAIPTAKYDEYKDYPGVLPVPGATIYRMMINGLGTADAQAELFPDSTWIPEPILANVDFKMAMFYAIDREYLATVVMKTRQPSIYLFSSAYIVDPELGLAYRDSEQGQTVGTNLAPDTFGFNFDAAQALYERALDKLVADGVYQDGTAANPTIITIEFNYFSGSESQTAMGDYLEQAFEAAFQSTNHYININLETYPKDFPSIYYDYMMTGDFDLSIGGISGSTLDAASFLDVFCSDNRGGFTLNWGIDTSQADIPVYYSVYDPDTETDVDVAEMWSYDAIVSALNGEVFLLDGEEGSVPAPTLTAVTETSFSFLIKEFDNPVYQDITFTVLYYDIFDDAYYPLPGWVGITPTSANVTVDGMDNYYYGWAADGLVYQGDYIVQVDYVYVQDNTKTGSSQLPWFTTDVILANSAAVADQDYVATPSGVAGLSLEFTENYPEEDVASIALYEILGTFTTVDVTDQVTLFVPDLQNIFVTGLNPDSTYALVVTFTDGYWDAINFSTNPLGEATVTATDTGATIDIVYDTTDYVRTVATATVYLYAAVATDPDTVVPGAAVDLTDNESLVVTGLTAENDYYVELVFDDGSVLYVDVTTTATPVA